jgi:hypothetical protein
VQLGDDVGGDELQGLDFGGVVGGVGRFGRAGHGADGVRIGRGLGGLVLFGEQGEEGGGVLRLAARGRGVTFSDFLRPSQTISSVFFLVSRNGINSGECRTESAEACRGATWCWVLGLAACARQIRFMRSLISALEAVQCLTFDDQYAVKKTCFLEWKERNPSSGAWRRERRVRQSAEGDKQARICHHLDCTAH